MIWPIKRVYRELADVLMFLTWVQQNLEGINFM